jgi:hypothetical protein
VRLRFLALVGWVATGHAAIGALYWALLQVPESNSVMLALSVCLVLLLVFTTAVVEITGLLAWTGRLRDAVGRAVRGTPWIIPAALLFALIWWATTSLDAWYGQHASQVDAWLLLKLKWTRTAWIHQLVGRVVWFLCYGVGLSMTLSLLARTTAQGRHALQSAAWLRQALGWRQLVPVAILVWAAAVLPWTLAYWRPQSLPTWLEPTFVAAKLLALYLVASIAWTGLLRTVGLRADAA